MYVCMYVCMYIRGHKFQELASDLITTSTDTFSKNRDYRKKVLVVTKCIVCGMPRLGVRVSL